MSFTVLPTGSLTHEELGIACLREEYAADRMALDEFEHRIGRLLAGDFSVVPMGGMPPPDTGRPETR